MQSGKVKAVPKVVKRRKKNCLEHADQWDPCAKTTYSSWWRYIEYFFAWGLPAPSLVYSDFTLFLCVCALHTSWSISQYLICGAWHLISITADLVLRSNIWGWYSSHYGPYPARQESDPVHVEREADWPLYKSLTTIFMWPRPKLLAAYTYPTRLRFISIRGLTKNCLYKWRIATEW